MNKKLLRETWFDELTRLWLTCDDDSCLLEVAVKRVTTPEVVEIEILQQAKDPRGLAIGPSLVIHREPIHCESGPNEGWLSGRCWLPSRFASPHIRNCYFRIVDSKPEVR